MNKFRAVAGALAALAVAAPAASANTDAEIFATNNTAVITDPADPRLNDRLTDFARQVTRIISEGGGRPGDDRRPGSGDDRDHHGDGDEGDCREP